MTRSLSVTPKTKEQHLSVRSGKSKVQVTIIKESARGIRPTLLKLTTGGHKASRGLSAIAELLVTTHRLLTIISAHSLHKTPSRPKSWIKLWYHCVPIPFTHQLCEIRYHVEANQSATLVRLVRVRFARGMREDFTTTRRFLCAAAGRLKPHQKPTMTVQSTVLPATVVGRREAFDRLIVLNPLQNRRNYSATSNNMKLVHWPLMGGLLHLVQQGGDWAGVYQ